VPITGATPLAPPSLPGWRTDCTRSRRAHTSELPQARCLRKAAHPTSVISTDTRSFACGADTSDHSCCSPPILIAGGRCKRVFFPTSHALAQKKQGRDQPRGRSRPLSGITLRRSSTVVARVPSPAVPAPHPTAEFGTTSRSGKHLSSVQPPPRPHRSKRAHRFTCLLLVANLFKQTACQTGGDFLKNTQFQPQKQLRTKPYLPDS
jgi:hypothetical protein